MDDPYVGVHLEVERPSGPLRGQTNATHWTNWKGVGNRVARFAEFPVVCMERLLTLLNRAGGTLGAKGAFPPSRILADQLTLFQGALFSHLPPSLCIILNMHNQMEFCTDIMIILGARSGPKTFWKGSIPLKLQYRWLFWIVRDYLQDLLSWSKIQLCAK